MSINPNNSNSGQHPVDEVARILNEIDTLLAGVRNEKSAFARTDQALKLARKAEAIAPEGPWKALCHYRIAHLLMRQDNQDLVEVDRHLRLAIHEPSLGPRPRIYHLALLRRLGRPQDEIGAAFHRALEAQSWKPEPVYGEAFFRNDDTFNMLELAAWFCEIPTVKMSGYGGILAPGANPPGTRRTDMPWVLLTNIDNRQNRRYSFVMAEEEGRRILEQRHLSLMLCSPQDDSDFPPQVMVRNTWTPYSTGSSNGRHEIQLLSALLKSPSLAAHKVEELLFSSDEVTDAALRKKISRINERVRELLQAPNAPATIVRTTHGWKLSQRVGLVALVEDGGASHGSGN